MRHISTTLLATILFILPRAAAAADEGEPSRAMYLRYCGACHGPEGKGDGVAASFMQPKPTDLTVIAKASKGIFPFDHVKAVIDGSAPVRAHGDAAMPVWGEVFHDQAGGDVTRRVETRGKLLLITEYVRTIQQQ